VANNNTYGVKLLPEEVYESVKRNFTKEGGCKDAIEQCRQLGNQGDPAVLGMNETVNELCAGALVQACQTDVIGGFMAITGVSASHWSLSRSVLSCWGNLLTAPNSFAEIVL